MKKTSSGFTIVELLIVIVVVGILAAITVVAYTGISGQARAVASQEGLTQAKKKLALYQVSNGAFPTTGNLSVAGISDGETTYQYTSDGTSYCLTATTGTTSYYLNTTTTTSPTSGGCAGHGQGGAGAVTNLIINPSFETNLTGWTGYYAPTRTQSNEQARCGSYSQKVVTTSTTQGNGTFSITSKPYTPGQVLYASVWVWAPNGMALRFGFRSDAGGLGSGGLAPVNFTGTGAWQQISGSYTVPSSPGAYYGPMVNNNNLVPGETFYIDCAMFAESPLPSSYSDPSVDSNWVWNGTANNSTSTGPAL